MSWIVVPSFRRDAPQGKAETTLQLVRRLAPVARPSLACERRVLRAGIRQCVLASMGAKQKITSGRIFLPEKIAPF